jgi:hypothetical protein
VHLKTFEVFLVLGSLLGPDTGSGTSMSNSSDTVMGRLRFTGLKLVCNPIKYLQIVMMHIIRNQFLKQNPIKAYSFGCAQIHLYDAGRQVQH